MRDLKSDLEFWQACKGLQAETAYVTPFICVVNSIVTEAIERAIASEEILASHAPAGHNVTNQQYQETRDKAAAFREESDIQRVSIQKLSAQVVGLRDCLDEAIELIEDIRDGNYIPDTFTTQPWKEILSQPDPGADIRERMEKLEAVADQVHKTCKNRCRMIHCQSGCPFYEAKIALAALGDRP
jgi:hypothetical protein